MTDNKKIIIQQAKIIRDIKRDRAVLRRILLGVTVTLVTLLIILGMVA